jgi:hypothetical protein
VQAIGAEAAEYRDDPEYEMAHWFKVRLFATGVFWNDVSLLASSSSGDYERVRPATCLWQFFQ